MAESSFEKLKFYDNCFKVLGISLVLFFTLFFMSGESDILLIISVILLIPASISLIIIGWGMIYHEYKRKDNLWLVATFILIVIGGSGFFVSIIYYFVKMRKEFKKGKGVYDVEISKKEKERIENYKKHKSEIDKKENKEFIKFIKTIGIILGVIILLFIIKAIFF